jgi:peptidoglycan hydrolase-like protein with peptidoglycan-binding domain
MAFGNTSLHYGDEGDYVRQLQEFLASQGFDPGPIDGVWGDQTNAAVAAWKQSVGLPGGGDLERTGIGGTSWPYITGDLVGEQYTGEDASSVLPPDESPAPPAEGSTATNPGVLGGGTLTRVTREGADDIWMMSYEWPVGSGQWLSWQFDSADQVAATFGAGWQTAVPFQTKSESFLDETQLLGSADQIVGVSGSFFTMMSDAMRQAAVTAGVSDPSLAGQIASDPEWQSIIAKAAIGGWTEEQIMADLRRTDLWTQTLYPGIESLYGRTAEPEVAWVNYARNVEQALFGMGYERDSDGSYRSTIGEMLDRGISDSLFVEAAPTFLRAEQSTNYRDALNLWTQERLGVDLDFADWFDVLDGRAAPEIGEVLELAQLQYAANVTGISASMDLISRVGADADLTEAEAFGAFNEAERNLLGLGDEALGRYGLTVDELVSAAAGITTDSGRSIEQVRLMARKAAFELGVADDAGTELFVGFSERGTPERPGLTALSPVRG